MSQYLTREEFDELMQGPEWTARDRAMFKKFTPVIKAGEVDKFRAEVHRRDGIVEVWPSKIR